MMRPLVHSHFTNRYVDERFCAHLHVAISVCFVGENAAEDPLTLHKRIVADSKVMNTPLPSLLGFL